MGGVFRWLAEKDAVVACAVRGEPLAGVPRAVVAFGARLGIAVGAVTAAFAAAITTAVGPAAAAGISEVVGCSECTTCGRSGAHLGVREFLESVADDVEGFVVVAGGVAHLEANVEFVHDVRTESVKGCDKLVG